MMQIWAPLLFFTGAGLAISSVLSGGPIAKLENPGNSTLAYSRESFVDGDLGTRPVTGGAEYNQVFVRHTSSVNSIVLKPFLLPSAKARLPHFLQSWLRNYISGVVVYFVSGGLWCLWVYGLKRDQYYPKGNIPATEPVMVQIVVSMKAMPLYTALPTLAEYFVEKGWTRCYAQIDEVGWVNWMLYNCAYMMFVEFFIYFMHRGLHDIKPLYKLLHATHHIYNKENTLSPFAGLAFNPIDGILQACPHVFALFVLPMHFLTHEVLLFCEAIWTTNIHDCIHGDVFGIMGAGYHTIHHTTYRHNYGHYTVFMDWLLGTLQDPKIKKEPALKSS